MTAVMTKDIREKCAAKKKGREMQIQKVEGRKKAYLDLLLLADPSEDMIDRYLERSDMYVGIVGGSGRNENRRDRMRA